jgi:uncharacterized membrane protein
MFNIPLNNALDRLVPNDPGSAEHWANYLTRWTAWNHLRAIISLIATALLVVGVRL